MQSRKLKVFISMPFTGKEYDDLYQERLDLKDLVESYGFELTEQFIGYQFKEDFASKDYDPKWVLGKDKNWLKQSDVVISDFTSYSIGTDFELVLSKEVFNKRVYAVVPQERRFHPWLKFYCNTFYDSVQDALEQIKKDFPDGPKEVPVDKRQYDPIAGEYRLVEETIVQKYIYDNNLEKQLLTADVFGKRVIVLHAGSGYRARIAKNLGAGEVLGVDLSYQNIRIAEDIELNSPEGIHYSVADIYSEEFLDGVPERFRAGTDIVVGYFALDHAMNEKELRCVAKNIQNLLSEGGVFIGMSDCPSTIESLPSKYGVVLSYDEKNKERKEGEPRRVSIYKDGKEVTHFHNFVWHEETLKKCLEEAGLEVSISKPVISQEAREDLGGDFWVEYQENPDQINITAKKSVII